LDCSLGSIVEDEGLGLSSQYIGAMFAEAQGFPRAFAAIPLVN
jgi:hypothetical protein